MKKAGAVIAILLTVILMFGACLLAEDIPLGNYITVEETAYGNAGVLIANDFEFAIYVDSLSYCPSGRYLVEGDNLTLTVNDEEIYRFKIEEDKLIFKSGEWLEKMIAVDTVFEFSGKYPDQIEE